jgi:hypothetical protein
VTVPDSVSPNTNQIRANHTVLSNNTNNDNQSSTLLNIDCARMAREIVRLQAGPTSTNVTTPVHSVLSTTTGNSQEHRDINLLPPLLSVPYVNENSQPSHGGDRKILEVMTSTLPKGTLGSVGFLLAATLYQGNPDRNHKFWNIVSSERYILHMQVIQFVSELPNLYIDNETHQLVIV